MQFDSIQLERTKGIVDKTPFSRLMCETLVLDLPKRLLDIGCGSGIVGLYCLLNDSEFVYFNDIQTEATELTLRNLNRYQLGLFTIINLKTATTSQPEVTQTSLLEAVKKYAGCG